MSSKILTIRDYEDFINRVAVAKPDEAYLLLPKGYEKIGEISNDISDTLIYTDLYINGIPKHYMSFIPELIGSSEIFLSPIILNTSRPFEIPREVLQDQIPINVITKFLMSKIAPIHVPQILFKWTTDQATEINTV